MNIPIRRALLLVAFAMALTGVLAAGSATYYVVYNLTGQSASSTAVAEGAPGLFYAATGNETIISVTIQGASTTVASFPSGYIIQSNPGAIAPNGLLYSSVSTISSANVFSAGPKAGSEKMYGPQTLFPHLAGNLPNGKLFGLAIGESDQIPRLSTTNLVGNVTSFYQFPATDRPSTPIFAADGNFYGISYPPVSGATSYFYRVTPSGSFTNIVSVPFISGAGGLGDGLILQAADGNFYGIQQEGPLGGCSSSNQHGAVYKLTPSGQFTILHDFGVCANAIIDSLLQGSDGRLYGIIEGDAQLFSLTTAGVYNRITLTNQFTGLCPCGLMQGSDGRIYGATVGGGATGAGVIFAIDAGLPVPKPQARQFSPTSGPVGTKVRIWGYNLFKPTVQFNGVAATSVHNAGSNYVWATVPTGATTGPITVTTPGGTVTTKASFTVR